MPLMNAAEAATKQCRMCQPVVLQEQSKVMNAAMGGRMRMEFPRCNGPQCALWAWLDPEPSAVDPAVEEKKAARRGHCGMVETPGL